MEEKPNILKQSQNKVQLATKTEGVQATHSYSIDELDAFCEHINFYLEDDESLKGIFPIKDHEKLFELVEDAQPGTIDLRAINMKQPLNIFKKQENLNLAISSSKSIGCVVVNIHPQLIMEKREHIILGLIWQIIKAQMIGNIDLKHHPFLIRLKEENEELEDLLKLKKDALLLRWINYHLKNAGHERKVNNFDKDLKDGVNYTILLNQLNSEKCDRSALDKDENTRATKIIEDANKLGVPKCIKPSDITKERTKLNQLFLAHIFNTNPGLTAEESEVKEAATLIDDDNPDQSREERVFAQWINSLGIEDVQINNLIIDLKDGVILNKVMEHMEPGTIDPKKISNKTQSRINRVQNANYAIENAKKLGMQIVGIGGMDVVDGKKKLVLAILWQLMRKNLLDKLGKLKEEDVLKWANSRIEEQFQVKTLKDKTLNNAKFFFKLFQSVESSIVDWDLVTPGETEEQIMNNAKYAISVARKLGATVYLVWEHIRDVNPKFLMSFIASIKYVADNK